MGVKARGNKGSGRRCEGKRGGGVIDGKLGEGK